MRSFLYFDEMITPSVITILYWLMLVGVVITGVGYMFASSAFGGGLSAGRMISGLLMMGVGALFARVWCEIIMVVFKIHENIKRMADK